MNTKEFSALLDSTIIASTIPSSIQDTPELLKLNEYVKSNIPQELFRFRKCKDRHFEDFYFDRFGVATGESMNDSFDSRIFFNKASIESWLDNLLSGDSDKEFMASIECVKTLPNELTRLLPGIENTWEKITNAPKEELSRTFQEIRGLLRNDLSSAINNFASTAQKTVLFASLSKNIKSTAMWGHYSDNETGFAVSYDFTAGGGNACAACPNKTLQCLFSKHYSVYPIIYSNERHQVSDEYVQYLLKYRAISDIEVRTNNHLYGQALKTALVCPDLLEATKISLHKSLEWAYEDEWRVFYYLNSPAAYNSRFDHFYKKPTSLYLGRKIKAINKKILIDFAKEKEIPVYEMKLNDNSPTYELKPERIV